ncbi:F-box/LRR-repeat protein 3-like [Copidosoma floridanum]|uniref:F-box/LRR-repeat protein 3-like n=1 Tax=Copidosoma floridanum TaxID=29053 RepID=UPI0006C9AE42|nr:F-box/LRR-repeat protein 3-like [Copidosoma floridanum]
MDDRIDKELCNMLHRIWNIDSDDFYFEDDCIEENIDDIVKPFTDDGVAIRKIFVGNIAQRTTHKDLEKLFSTYGELDSCFVKRQSGKSNFAFVTFRNKDDALKAAKDGYQKKIHLHNRDLRVMPADSWHQPDSIEYQSKKGPKFTEDFVFELNVDAEIHKLNDDCLIHIFSYLPIVDRIVVERVCRRWKVLSKQSWSTFKKLDLMNSTWGFGKPKTRGVELDRVKFNNFASEIIDTPILRKVLLRCGQFLTHIDISLSTDRLNVSTLTIIGKMCPNLQYISTLTVTPAGIKALTESCKEIETLSLGRCSNSCDNDLSQLFQKNKKLRYLRIMQNAMTGKCLLNLPADSIETVILIECRNISPCYFANAIEKLHNLHTLTVTKCVTFNDQAVKGISSCSRNLKVLNFCDYFPMIRKSVMINLADLINLETLEVPTNDSVHDEFLIAVGKQCKQLSTVNVSSCNFVTNEGLASITSLPNLQHLSINYLGKVTDEVLTLMPNLRTMECRGCPRIKNTGLCTLLEESHNLELLDFSGCNQISNKLIEVAIASTKSRPNNILLKMYVGGTTVNTKAITKVSPLLQVLNVDLSEAYLRPDFEHDGFFWDDDIDQEDIDIEYDSLDQLSDDADSLILFD